MPRNRPTVKLFSDTYYGRTYVYRTPTSPVPLAFLDYANPDKGYVFVRSEEHGRNCEAVALREATAAYVKRILFPNEASSSLARRVL